jgi:cell division protein YceG involved in septum cleavage
MRTFILAAAIMTAASTTAQSNITSNIIEGGKTLVELVRVFKTPKTSMGLQSTVEKKDSCAIKAVTDICIKNSTANPVIVSLYKRNGNVYETTALSVKVLPKNQEFIYEVKSGIYKMKIEMETGEVKKLFKEGEMKVNACENVFKEIKNEG